MKTLNQTPAEETKRILSEVIVLYILEESLRDIYVEGITDKNFYQNYLDSKKIDGNFVPITSINFLSINEEFKNKLDVNSNKDMVIALSRAFNKQPKRLNVRCIVDRDFDDYTYVEENDYLWRTDFTCLESYLFCIDIKNKFIKMGLVNFPIESKKVLNEIGRVIKFLFSIRLWKEINNSSVDLVEIDKNLKVNKNNGETNFDEEDYIDKFILKNNLKKEEEKFKKEIKALQGQLNIDVRFAMNKKDFLKVFYLYVNKIKNIPNYTEEAFSKALYLTPECSHLEVYPLFEKIEDFFSE